jgi:hypothetical protein
MVNRVWNADKGVILDWQAPLRAGGDVTGIAEIPAAGKYYIEVADSRDDARSPSPYTLKAVLNTPKNTVLGHSKKIMSQLELYAKRGNIRPHSPIRGMARAFP